MVQIELCLRMHSTIIYIPSLPKFCFSPPQSTMSDVSPGEEFVSSLGADQSIRITVRPVATVHNTRTAMLGGAKTNTITYTHTFLVKNTRSDSVNIKVSEQVPLSTDDRIKVQQLWPSQLVFATFIQCHTAASTFAFKMPATVRLTCKLFATSDY